MAASSSTIAPLLASKLQMMTSRPLPFSIPSISCTFNSRKPLTKISSINLQSSSDHVLPQTPYDLPSADETLSDRWRQIHGEDDWAGLLDPIDQALRSELIRYGDMAQACYDAFDFDPHSDNCGGCKYAEADLFAGLEMDRARVGYTVTRYLYATSSIDLPKFFHTSAMADASTNNSNWIGYVAVSDDDTSARIGRRDIAVVWRGTVTKVEWIHDLIDFLGPLSYHRIPCHDPTVKVESGFDRLYTTKLTDLKNPAIKLKSPRDEVHEEISRLVKKYGDCKKDELELSITMAGHSLGSALAVLSAFDMAETGRNLTHQGREVPVSVFSFAGPRVGNGRFKDRLDRLGVKVLRVHNVHDVVPTAPGVFINEHWPNLVVLADGLFPWCYSHVGTELTLDHDRSTFLKAGRKDRAHAHNLELLLHLIDGYQGTGKHFQLETPRDKALLNKDADLLNEECNIPPFWRQDRNKGLVRDSQGHWVRPPKRRGGDDDDTSVASPHSSPEANWGIINTSLN